MNMYKSLMVVAIMGVVAIPSEAGDSVKRATKNAEPSTMGKCLAPCDDADCLRACIANVEGPLGPRAATQQSLNDCFGEAISNITSCAAVILLRADDAKFDVDSAFWSCVNVASRLFNQCPSHDPGLTVELETMLRRISLGHLVNAAEDDYKLYLAGKLTAYRLNVDATPDGGDKSPPRAQNESYGKSKPRTNMECRTELSANLGSCESKCGRNSICLTGCNSVALNLFEQCTRVTPTK